MSKYWKVINNLYGIKVVEVRTDEIFPKDRFCSKLQKPNVLQET